MTRAQLEQLPISELKKLAAGFFGEGLKLEAEIVPSQWRHKTFDTGVSCVYAGSIFSGTGAAEAEFIAHSRNVYRPMAELGSGICAECEHCGDVPLARNEKQNCPACLLVRPILIAFLAEAKA